LKDFFFAYLLNLSRYVATLVYDCLIGLLVRFRFCIVYVIDNYENWWTVNMTCKGAASPLQEGRGIKRFKTSSDSSISII